jgi:glycosyltransferase involved in cell wall biosynthesis
VRLFGWTADEGGLARIRIGVPFEELAKHGYETSLDTVFVREHGDSDTIVGCRIAMPDPSRLWTHACGMMGGPFCVFETDDDNLNISPYNRYGPYQFWGKPEVRWHYLANMRVAHRIVTSTPYLAELLMNQTGHPDIVIAPNAVPDWMLDLPSTARTDGIITVGWAGGVSHNGDWDWARKPIRRALALLKNQVEFHSVGADYTKGMRLPPHMLRHTPWFADTDEYWRHGIDFHVGLAPLRPDTFNKSKSNIKLIEYAARGVPVIASDYGPYADFVQDGVTGILVKTPAEWKEAIHFLVTDHQLREQMGKQAKEQAREHVISHLWPKYEEAYTP